MMVTKYNDEVHQVTYYEDGCRMETFWCEVLGCTVCITLDDEGIRVHLMDDNKVVKGGTVS